MEGAADPQGHTALGTQFLGEFSRPVHSGLLAADDQLAGAVIIADLHHAQLTCLVAGRLQLVPLQGEDGGHAACQAFSGLLHGTAPEGQSLQHGLPVQHPGGIQGGVLPQGQARRRAGADAPGIQQVGDPHGEGRHAGLGVAGLRQRLDRPFKGEGFQVKVQPGVVQHRPVFGVLVIEVPAHAHFLAALTGVYKG